MLSVVWNVKLRFAATALLALTVMATPAAMAASADLLVDAAAEAMAAAGADRGMGAQACSGLLESLVCLIPNICFFCT